MLTHRDVLEIMDIIEFDLIVNQDCTLSVIDKQEANLGDIESKIFNNFNQLIEGLSTYINDYIVNTLCYMFDLENDNEWSVVLEEANKHNVDDEYLRLFRLIMESEDDEE